MEPTRNDPCPCGSGKKYKMCCGQIDPTDRPGVHEITDERQKADLLRATQIGLMLAGESSEHSTFNAAHGDRFSVAVLAWRKRGEPEVVTVWKLVGGTKDDRRRQAQSVRDKYGDPTKKP